MTRKKRGEEDFGRPPKFKSAQELQEKIDGYFRSCYDEQWEMDDKGKWYQVLDRFGEPVMVLKDHMTITGLAVYLNTTRRTLLDYENEYGPEFSHTIKMAKARIEHYTEKQLYNTQARNGASIQFVLKNNYGWVDKQDHDITANVDYAIVPPPPPGES